jgi:hypothetical protein
MSLFIWCVEVIINFRMFLRIYIHYFGFLNIYLLTVWNDVKRD